MNIKSGTIFFVLFFSVRILALSLVKFPVVYNMAQQTEWIDEKELAIGRWDGTVTIFRRDDSSEIPARLIQTMKTPSGLGIQMLGVISGFGIIASNTEDSMVVWVRFGDNQKYFFKQFLYFDNKLGMVNSFSDFVVNNQRIIVTGHANGYLTVWEFSNNKMRFLHAINVQSSNPISSSYPLKNIRSVVHYQGSQIIIASEDGDISIIDSISKDTVFRQRYQPSAQRGLNRIFVRGNFLVAANCAVGQEDNNIWLYRIHLDNLELLDALHLKENKDSKQVFNAGSVISVIGNEHYVFSGTQEGLLWVHKIDNCKLVYLQRRQVVNAAIAPIIALGENNWIATVSHEIRIFRIEESSDVESNYIVDRR